MSESVFFLWQVCLNTSIHTLNFWRKKGGQTSRCSLVLAWGQFGPIEIEIFLPSIFGAKSTYRSYFIALPQLMMKIHCPRNVSEIARNVASRLSLSCFGSNLIIQDSTIGLNFKYQNATYLLFFLNDQPLHVL